jgi:hypothetical protein
MCVFPNELSFLILRSPLAGVSKDEAVSISPFETRLAGAPQGEDLL